MQKANGCRRFLTTKGTKGFTKGTKVVFHIAYSYLDNEIMRSQHRIRAFHLWVYKDLQWTW